MQNKSLSKYYVILLWLFSLIATGFSYYKQHIENLNPCSLCLIQRYIYIGIALCPLLFLAFKNRKLKLVILSLTMLGSSIVSGYNVLLENRIIEPIFSCATPLDLSHVMDMMPSDCSIKQYAFLNLTLAELNFIFSLIMFMIGIYIYGKEFSRKEKF